MNDDGYKVRNSKRVRIDKKVEFFVDADIITADSIDISETGIKFRTDFPIKVRMRLENEDKVGEERTAELVWAQKDANGQTVYGLHFIKDSDLSFESSHNYSDDDFGEW